MKKSTIVGLSFIGVGIIVSIIAITTIGPKSFYYNDGRLGRFISYFSDDYDFNRHHNYKGYSSNDSSGAILDSKEEKLLEFTSLEIDLNYSNVELIGTDEEEFKIKITYLNNSKIYYSVNNDNLKIYDNRKRHNSRYKEANDVKIYIPKDRIIKNLYTDFDLGSTTIRNLNIEQAEMDNDLGSINFYDSNISQSDIYLNLGQLKARNTIFTNSELENELGNIDIEGQLLGENDISVSMGAIDLNLNQNKEDTGLNAETSMGSINIDGESYSGVEKDISVNNSAENIIELESSMGAIKIQFK